MKPEPSPDRPWLMDQVTHWLDRILQPEWKVLETGSGGSTVFFAERVASVITYEHDLAWVSRVRAELRSRNLNNVEVRAIQNYPVKGLQIQASIPDPHAVPSIDLAFIDGRGRVKSVIDVLPAIKSGGWLVLDDSDRQRYAEAYVAADAVCGPKVTYVSGPDHTTIWRKL